MYDRVDKPKIKYGGKRKMAEAIDYEALEQYLSVREVAELFNVRKGTIRRLAKEGLIPGAKYVFKRWGFDPKALENWTPPEEKTSRERKPKREDGRQRYTAMLTKEEAAELIAAGYEVTDPREVSKARRAARKAAKTGETGEAGETTKAAEAGDPFADFGL